VHLIFIATIQFSKEGLSDALSGIRPPTCGATGNFARKKHKKSDGQVSRSPETKVLVLQKLIAARKMALICR
jgi:hypothetical protein